MSSADQKKSSGNRPNVDVDGIKAVIKPDAPTNISSKENEVSSVSFSSSTEDDSIDATKLDSLFNVDMDSLRLSRSKLNLSKSKLDASQIGNDDDDDDDYLSDEELKTPQED
jgi:hypothetical protein